MDDLSTLADGSLSMGCSMGASNTISVPPAFGARGSESEASESILTHSTPEMDLGTRDDYARFEHSGADEAHAGYGWDLAQGVNHG